MDVAVETMADERIRAQVQAIYGEAANEPKGLCCPKKMPGHLTDHIPAAAFQHSYGCGSPIAAAAIGPGQVVADLGCGVGIDCFAAAKLVGPAGRVIGVDMSNDMLSRAYAFNAEVARNLGYDVVGFRKGTIDQLPLENSTVDLIVSNCVVNLATDKKKVFKEVFRALRHGGRFVISDVVSDRDIRPEDRSDPEEWTECTVSTLSLRAFLDAITEAGFVGLVQLAEEAWRVVKGYHLSSITLEARKFETDCHAGVSHLAIYLGPYAEVKDDLGNAFPRFKPVAVRDDVASFLGEGPTGKSFIVVAGRGAAKPAKPPQAEAAPGRRASPCCDPTDKVEPCCENNQPKADGSPCCDTYALEQAAGCGCSPATIAAPAQPVAASACGDSGGCGPGATAASAAALPASACCDGGSCGSDAEPAAVRVQPVTAADECCPCETEAKQTDSACCGAGCGTCGCS
jgi:arsenite methyltransferase